MTISRTKKSVLPNGSNEVLALALSLNEAKNIDEILLELSKKIKEFCRADGVTIYALDHAKNELYSKIKGKDSIEVIRLPVDNSSIAGYAARTRSVINVGDPYEPENLVSYIGVDDDMVNILTDDPYDTEKVGGIALSVSAAAHHFYVGLREDILKIIDVAYGKRHPEDNCIE